jgi:hypothetical protein
MTTPITIGAPQLILFLLAALGLGLLLWSVMGLAGKGRVEKYVDHRGVLTHRHRRHFRAGHAAGGIVILAIALSLLWAVSLVQSYLGLTADIPAARVHATAIEGEPHLMSVELVLFDKDGHQTSDKTYLVKGDRWQLQGNILKFPGWLNIFGLHSGYKITRLEGQYEDINLEENSKHTAIELNGGDGDFFKTVYKQAWTSPFVDAAYANAVLEPADGHTYNILISQTGLYAKPAK